MLSSCWKWKKQSIIALLDPRPAEQKTFQTALPESSPLPSPGSGPPPGVLSFTKSSSHASVVSAAGRLGLRWGIGSSATQPSGGEGTPRTGKFYSGSCVSCLRVWFFPLGWKSVSPSTERGGALPAAPRCWEDEKEEPGAILELALG